MLCESAETENMMKIPEQLRQTTITDSNIELNIIDKHK